MNGYSDALGNLVEQLAKLPGDWTKISAEACLSHIKAVGQRGSFIGRGNFGGKRKDSLLQFVL